MTLLCDNSCEKDKCSPGAYFACSLCPWLQNISKSQLTLLLFLISQGIVSSHPQMGSLCSSLVFGTLHLHPHFWREKVRTLKRHKIRAQGVLSYLSFLQIFLSHSFFTCESWCCPVYYYLKIFWLAFLLNFHLISRFLASESFLLKIHW